MSLKGFYKTDVVTVTADVAITEVAALMRDRKVGDVVVVDSANGKTHPIGMITDRDIVIDCIADGAKNCAEVKVKDVMTTAPVCAREDEGLYEIVHKMRTQAVGRLPIVDDKGYLIGIITSKNILALLSDELTELVSIADAQEQGLGRARNAAAGTAVSPVL